jgi:hypothetical protein
MLLSISTHFFFPVGHALGFPLKTIDLLHVYISVELTYIYSNMVCLAVIASQKVC